MTGAGASLPVEMLGAGGWGVNGGFRKGRVRGMLGYWGMERIWGDDGLKNKKTEEKTPGRQRTSY